MKNMIDSEITMIDDEIKCPICLMEIRSDAYTRYCSLCGMNTGNDSLFVKRNRKKFDFCSETCKRMFLKLGFRSFGMFKIKRGGIHG